MRVSVKKGSRRRRKPNKHTRVWLNDVEVTVDCRSADSRVGVVELMLRDDEGKHYINASRTAIAAACFHGRVRIER